MRILIVEDEMKMADALQRALRQAGYTVDVARDGDHALDHLLVSEVDLFLLDVMLPGKDGFAVLKELRAQRCRTPCLMLTARDDTASKVRGLDLGADDYLAKPFDVAELLARIRALLRRGGPERSAVLRAADLELDPAAMEVRRGGRRIAVTVREYQLLELLLRNKNRVMSRDSIFERIWASEFAGSTKVVDVYVNYLRGKIDQGFDRKLVHTVRGIGYMLQDAPA